jgi:hypothetical protein
LTAEGVNAFYAEDKSREAAVLYFNEAIKTDPTYADAYFYRGQAYVALKKSERAIADFKKALELELETDQRQAAADFLAGLQTPPAGPVPSPAAVASTPFVSPTISQTGLKPSPSPTKTFPEVALSRPPISKAETSDQVSAMFSPEKTVRIQATTKLIIEQKMNAEAVSLAIKTAQNQLDNKAGVINTLVYLESVPPDLLKARRKEVAGFLDAVKKSSPGPQTQEHLNKVTDALNKP